MGKVLSTLTRQVKMFNIEERAHKIISKEKPVAAPIHEKTVKEIEMLMKENPDGISKLQKKDENLDLYLKNLYVVSHDPNTTIVKSKKQRPLPQERESSSNLVSGYVEPEEVPVGKFTLKQALQFLSDHQTQPQVHTAEVIARQYKIDQKVAENMIRYYAMFGLHIPDGKQEKIKLKIPDNMENLTASNLYRVVKAQAEKLEKHKLKYENDSKKNEKLT